MVIKDYRPPITKDLFEKDWLPVFNKENDFEKIADLKKCSLKHVKNVFSYYRDFILYSDEKSDLFKKTVALLKIEKSSISYLAETFKQSKDTIYQIIIEIEKAGYALRNEIYKGDKVIYYIQTISNNEAAIIISPKSRKVQEIKCLFISDFHGGCKQFAKRELEETLRRGWEEFGLRHCYIAGDLCDGINVYNGHLNNLKYWKEEDQVAEVCGVLAKYNYDYYAIGGNHDYSWEKRGGPNPVALIAKEIPDFHYLHSFAVDIVIEGVLLRIVHGTGGTAYAKSYPLQKYLGNVFESGEHRVIIDDHNYEMKILLFGHTHQWGIFGIFGTYAFLPGNFQFPNEYTTRRGLVGPQGGWAINFTVVDGKIKSLTPIWLEVSNNNFGVHSVKLD